MNHLRYEGLKQATKQFERGVRRKKKKLSQQHARILPNKKARKQTSDL